jgi:hypothetical protein
LLGGDKSTQRAIGADEVALSDQLVERPRSQQFRERCDLAQALGDGVIEQRRSSRPFGGL